MVEWPPISAFDRSAIASNTGCTSDGEMAITFSTSAVAVCRSSASCGLVEQPCVLDRDHGLVGERPQQLDVMIGEHTRLPARADDETDEHALAHQEA